MTRKHPGIKSDNEFINFHKSRVKELEAEVKSLKEDWLMCDEVCDQKELKIRELTRLARNVVVGKQKLSDLNDYLGFKVINKSEPIKIEEKEENNGNRK